MDGNIHNLRDALEWLDRIIRDEAELDGEMSNDHAIQLGFITNMLEKFPLRQCDVGTADEQKARMLEYCKSHKNVDGIIICERCPHHGPNWTWCALRWAQMPYEAQEGGAK